MSDHADLTSLLTQIKDNFDGESLTVHEMIAAMEDRGFGPLLLLPALLVILPTGAIPGVPTLMALVNTLIAGQLILGRKHPWIPHRLGAVSIGRETFDAAVKRAIPITRRIDRLLYPRLKVLTRAPGPRLIAALCLALGLTMMPLEILPFAAAVPASAIAFMALGLSARDGLLIGIGLLVAAAGLGAIAYLGA